MKLSETFLEAMNDIDPVYLEKSEKEYGWLYRYRKQITAVLSLSAVLVFCMVLMPKSTNMDAGSYEAVPAENMKEDESVYDSAETAGIAVKTYVVRLQDENGNAPDDAALLEVCDTLMKAGCDAWIDEQGNLVIAGEKEELQAYLDRLKYSYELEEQ